MLCEKPLTRRAAEAEAAFDAAERAGRLLMEGFMCSTAASTCRRARLGREDAVGQARAIDALYAAAD